MKYRGLEFRNAAGKTVEIDIEGYIGYEYWDDEQTIIHTKEQMKAELKKLGELNDVDTIIVNINSYGGDINHGISIHDLLASNKAKVITKINGMTASAATIIAMAGDERHISDNALFLVHNASTWAWGNKNVIKVSLDDLEKVDGRMVNIYAKVTGSSDEEMQAVMNRNNGNGEWITADEAKELGFITDIFEPKKAAASFSNDLLRKHGLPPIPTNANEQQTIESNIDEEKIANSVYAKVKSFFTDIIKPNTENSKKQIDMSKFPKLSAIIKVEKIEVTDQGVVLSEDNITHIENSLNENATAMVDLEALSSGIDAIDESIAKADGKDAKLEALKAFVDKKPATEATAIKKEMDKHDDVFKQVAKDEINKEVDNL